jgi:large subunit ribosomal protein L17
MRHRKNFNHLSRTSTHRKAMLSNMAASLILHKRIRTTVAKAKALRSYVEPLINKSKEDTTHSRRVVFSYLQSKEAVTELFRDVAPKVAERPGGYTRIIKMGNRIGDNADMCLMELVDYNQHLLAGKESAAAEKTAGRRRRRGSGKAKKEDESKAQPAVVAEMNEEPVVEEVVLKQPKAEEMPESTGDIQESDVEVKNEPQPDEIKEPEAVVEENADEVKMEEPADEAPKAETYPQPEKTEDDDAKEKKTE